MSLAGLEFADDFDSVIRRAGVDVNEFDGAGVILAHDSAEGGADEGGVIFRAHHDGDRLEWMRRRLTVTWDTGPSSRHAGYGRIAGLFRAFYESQN